MEVGNLQTSSTELQSKLNRTLKGLEGNYILVIVVALVTMPEIANAYADISSYLGEFGLFLGFMVGFVVKSMIAGAGETCVPEISNLL